MKKKLVPAPAASLTKLPHSAVTKAVHKYLPALQSALDDYETEHPHWRIEVLVSLIKWSLKSLKHYIEEVHDTKITWADPLVELHYPVEWNWKQPVHGDTTRSGLTYGTFTKQSTATKAAALKTVSKIMVAQHTTTALADLTNGVWYDKRKDYYTPFLPLDLKAELDAVKNPCARRAVFDELARPFSIGAARIDLDDAKLKPGARVPKRVIEQLGRTDMGGIRFTGDVNGREVDMGLIFEIQPLIADYDQRKAYHPITVGLAALNGNARLVGGELVQDTPANWPKRDRQEFWDGLLREMDKLTTLLIPEEEQQKSVILSVNATLKIPAEHWRPKNQSAESKRVADALAQLGEVSDLKVESTGDYYSCFISYSREDKTFARLLHDRLQGRAWIVGSTSINYCPAMICTRALTGASGFGTRCCSAHPGRRSPIGGWTAKSTARSRKRRKS